MTWKQSEIYVHKVKADGRIGILDGFRALAILMVVAFHYFARWTPPRSPENIYPYGDLFAHFTLIKYGNFGVELFFIISGFVISLTLFVSLDWADFAMKRFSRLFPTMLLSSVLTYTFLKAVGSPWFERSHLDFLPSLTFTDPGWWTSAFGGTFNSMDGAYWSLEVEVKFYLLAGLLFFLFGPQRFLLSFAVLLASECAFHIATKLAGRPVPELFYIIFFPDYLPWFVAGIGFYFLYRNHANRLAPAVVAGTLLIVIGMDWMRGNISAAEGGVKTSLFCLFGLFIFRPHWLTLFSWRPLTAVGEASYSLYLLHQFIGVTIIGLIGRGIGRPISPAAALIGVAVAGLMILLSLAIYRYWEMPAKRFLLGWHKRKRRSAAI